MTTKTITEAQLAAAIADSGVWTAVPLMKNSTYLHTAAAIFAALPEPTAVEVPALLRALVEAIPTFEFYDEWMAAHAYLDEHP